MKILGIETSCDETAVCILEAEGGSNEPRFRVLGNAVYSQVKVHEQYGGVFPMMAKREHAANLVPLLLKALSEADIVLASGNLAKDSLETARKTLEREPELFEAIGKHIAEKLKPDIDRIAVTHGPGLEPALWVGVNFAKVLSMIWDIPVMAVNHMEGHVASVLLDKTDEAKQRPKTQNSIEFPALALLISGGHTELVLAEDWTQYSTIGETRDDAVGEAFDKVARMLGLPYPGGPHISALAEMSRKNADSMTANAGKIKLPRPMINTGDFDFSFSGLKTAVLYTIKKYPALDNNLKREIAREFEDAVTDVLVAKTRRAAEAHDARSIILGGGVAANRKIRAEFEKLSVELAVPLYVPAHDLSTDNAIMIAAAAYVRTLRGDEPSRDVGFEAKGNLRIGQKKIPEA
jgi:N6-L-threonylcarbamoyladenine synthase